MARAIYIDNAWLEIIGPVSGINPATWRHELYHSDVVVAWITEESGSDDPVGGLEVSCPEIGDTAAYPVVFTGAALTAALDALAEGATLFRVVESPGDFRVEDELVLRKVRPS